MLKDMTVGNPSRVLIKFALPIILSGIFQQLYNIVDSVVAGKFAGVDALAAVGASYPITMLYIAVAIGGAMGCGVVVSQLFGAKELTRMKTAIYTAIFAMLILSAILTVVGIFCCDPLMRLLGTPSNIFADSAEYLRIYVWGLVFLFVYNIANAVFTGLGDSVRPLIFLIFSSVFNIVLDYVFVAYCGWGVAGVAWATFIAQGIASVLSITTLLIKVKRIKTDACRLFDGRALKRMSRIAGPSIIQFSIVSIGQLCVQGLVNSFGSGIVAGYSAGIKIDSFMKMPLINMGQAYTSFTAQNIGAGNTARVREGYRATLKTTLLMSGILIAVAFLFKDALIGFFLDSSAEATTVVMDTGAQYLITVALGYIPFAFMMSSNGVLRGAGAMKYFTTVTLIDLVARVGLAYLLANFIGASAIWLSIPIGWVVGAVISGGFYKKGVWLPKTKIV